MRHKVTCYQPSTTVDTIIKATRILIEEYSGDIHRLAAPLSTYPRRRHESDANFANRIIMEFLLPDEGDMFSVRFQMGWTEMEFEVIENLLVELKVIVSSRWANAPEADKDVHLRYMKRIDLLLDLWK